MGTYKHKGLRAHRLRSLPEEKRFAAAWVALNELGTTVDHLLDDRAVQGGVPPRASDRDHVVAATLIQWLGSPCGQEFLSGLGCKLGGELSL